MKKLAKLFQFILVSGAIIVSGCDQMAVSVSEEPNSSEMSANNMQRADYVLKTWPVRGEIIEAHVDFLAPVSRSNDKLHFSYELNILNNNRNAITIKKIEIIDPKKPTGIVATFDGASLNDNFARPGKRPKYGVAAIDANGFGIANIWLSLDEDNFPTEIFHRLTIEIEDSEGQVDAFVLELARIDVPRITQITLGIPFEKGTWLYATSGHRNSRMLTEGHASYAQRFAVDWLRIGEDGRFFNGDPSKNESFYSYATPVRAVADGIVIAIKDGIVENVPFSETMAVEISRETIGGNSVLLDIGNNVNAFYGHLTPGSLRVIPGQAVKKGDVLGLLGNSGSSDAPHLHFHLELKTPQNQPLSGEGVPYVFADFERLQQWSDVEVEVVFGTGQIDVQKTSASHRRNELPNGEGLLEFK